MKLPDINDKAALAAYLSAALADADTAKFVKALATVVKAHGVTAVAQDAGLSRDTLYRILRGERQPQYDTVVAILAALKLKLSAEAITTK